LVCWLTQRFLLSQEWRSFSVIPHSMRDL